MSPEMITILALVVSFALGGIIGLFVLKPKKEEDLETIRKKAEKLLQDSHKEVQNIKKDAQDRAHDLQQRSRQHEEKLKVQCEKIEKLILSKEEQLQAKGLKNKEIQAKVEEENKNLQTLEAKNKEKEKEITLKLGQKTGISIEKAKNEIINELERDLELERQDRLRKYETYLKEERERLSKNLITAVIQRYSAPTSVDKKNMAIIVPRDEYKARVIGKDGEILALLEELTGVDIVFNDAPESINVSCFDLIRKHIARETIVKLLKERNVTPEKVHQKFNETKQETERTLIAIGQKTVKMLGLEDRKFPPDFMRVVGRLKFRTSYGQNILKHSFEVGYFTLMLGGELDLDMTTSKIGGFFHDLGKAIDQEVGGSHDVLTKEIMEKYNFSEDEIHAAWTHHDAIPQRTAEAMLVKAGDAISAGRPGARQESLEKYIERIQAIEKISLSYEGVSKTYAISAGREVRVMVEPQILRDDDLPDLAANIAEEIQENVAYPGKIKINVIRRTKNTSYAK
jgi:ribonuclease Y